MKDEYDFAGAERGKFFVKDAVVAPPGRLEPDTRSDARAVRGKRRRAADPCENGGES
ncbi:MAG: hypothetical protein ACREEB_14595 [Caulobacteraceae bacterium]